MEYKIRRHKKVKSLHQCFFHHYIDLIFLINSIKNLQNDLILILCKKMIIIPKKILKAINFLLIIVLINLIDSF
ncbi:hypothetical protein UMN179_02306 [Gallibacterium anatis UMN179]|uniref:Uncharacterized protein n=1 Tax=Gallibacterium anatis (strain UMN179) TaxID=1005058 RepID=F4HFW4_GALAU|nr:hypothetical protein UMN179_02306 [Gallibacterium anatis UMN179]